MTKCSESAQLHPGQLPTETKGRAQAEKSTHTSTPTFKKVTQADKVSGSVLTSNLLTSQDSNSTNTNTDSVHSTVKISHAP